MSNRYEDDFRVIETTLVAGGAPLATMDRWQRVRCDLAALVREKPAPVTELPPPGQAAVANVGGTGGHGEPADNTRIYACGCSETWWGNEHEPVRVQKEGEWYAYVKRICLAHRS